MISLIFTFISSLTVYSTFVMFIFPSVRNQRDFVPSLELLRGRDVRLMTAPALLSSTERWERKWHRRGGCLGRGRMLIQCLYFPPHSPRVYTGPETPSTFLFSSQCRGFNILNSVCKIIILPLQWARWAGVSVWSPECSLAVWSSVDTSVWVPGLLWCTQLLSSVSNFHSTFITRYRQCRARGLELTCY